MQDINEFASELDAELSGSVSLPGQPGYESAVLVWAKPKVLPKLVAHCLTEADVQAAVRAARRAGMPLSVRGGGHDLAARGLCEGLTLDLRRLNSVGPITAERTIEVEGGAKGNDVFAVTDPAGLAPVLGAVADVGIAGMMSCGGYGTLASRFGMACDNLRAARVVLADGSLVRAAEDGDGELFWAIRGGGGNFGVITSMELELHPVGTVRSGLMLFPFANGDEILPRLEEIWEDAPLELDVQVGLIPGAQGEPVIYVSPTWSGDLSLADAALEPLNALGHCIMSDVRDQPFGVSRTFYDPHIVNGRRVTGDTTWLREWNADISRIVMDAMRHRPTPLSVMLCHEFTGAATEVPSSDTAFALREPHFWFEVFAPMESDSDSDGLAEAAWVHRTIDSLRPYSFDGGYPNFLEPAEAARAAAGFGSNSARLAAAKRTYDPDNVFFSSIDLP